MEAKLSQSLRLSAWIDSEKLVKQPLLQFSPRCRKQDTVSMLIPSRLNRRALTRGRPVALKVLNSQNISDTILESGKFPATIDEATILKNKAEEIEPYLSGRCIYLVGMMGSGKTTIGRILSEVLAYSFYDSDALIEEAVGGTTVAEIFKLYGENVFRDNETEVLRELSFMHRLVVSTGGGAVIRPINWKYMNKGISVWLDVPLEALARRITAVGTASRPLLHHGSGDAYTKAFKHLCNLFEKRAEAYTNASARVSLENIAAKLGYEDVCELTPTVIAIEALVQIENFLKK